MAAVVKIGAFLALGAVWLGLFGSTASVVIAREAFLLLGVGIASVIIGAITGLAQNSAKRILAFSAIANAGFILFGFCYPYFAKAEVLDLSASFYFLLVYAIASMGALTGISSLVASFDNMEDLRGTAKRNPFMGICVSVCLASLAGLPVAAGFLAKFRIFASLVQASFESPAIWGIAIAAFVLAVTSATYYIRIMYFMWSNAASNKERVHTSFLLNAGVGVATAVLLALAVWVPM